jgi:hypothetical protein
VEVLEDGAGGGGAEDAGHDAPVAAAAGAGEDVRLERPLEQFGPGDGAAGAGRADVLNVLRRHRAGNCLGQRRGKRRWDGAGAHPGVGSEDAEVADEVGPRWRDERGEAAEESHRSQDEVRLPGRGGPLHPVGEATIRQRRERPYGFEAFQAWLEKS